MSRMSIDQVDVAGKRVLMRVDFNVPLADGAITDDRRIRLSVPSIRSVVERGGSAIVMSHMGRPKGAGPEPALSLAVAADRLREILGSTVHFAADCVGDAAAAAVASLGAGEVLVLENLRFEPGEKKGDPDFASRLAVYGDVYCNEAFGASHRSDASMLAVPSAMQGKPRVAGLLLEKELSTVGAVFDTEAHPTLAILGGAKVSDKLGVIRNMIGRVDTMLIGGAMSYTLLGAQGIETGKSLVEPDRFEDATAILAEAASSSTDLVLPVDHVCGTSISSDSPIETTAGTAISGDWMGLDIGPRTAERYAERIRAARTIVWNGPMGAFETEPFDVGTRAVAEAVADAADAGAVCVIGGGDSAAAVEQFGLADRCGHVSTGGGASLALLEGAPMPAIDVLDLR